MLIKLLLAIVITLLFYARYKVGFKMKIFFHPLLLAPALGWLLSPAVLGLSKGTFSAGVVIGVLTELLWGSNLVDFTSGLQYGLLASLLSVSLVALTGNINLLFPLSLVVLLLYSWQETVAAYFSDKKWYIYLIGVFNYLILLGSPLVEKMLGWLPAEILDNITIAEGLLPAVALGFIFVQGVFPVFKRDNIWYYAYLLSTLMTSVLMINGEVWAALFFPLVWYSIYYLWNQTKEVKFKKYFRYSLAVIVVIIAVLFLKFDSPYVTTNFQYVLWGESLVALFVVLRFLKLTAIEGYFIMILLSIIGSKIGVFI